MSEIVDDDGKPMISMITSAQANRSAETRGRDQRSYEDTSITGLSDKTSQHAEELAVEAMQLSAVSGDLKELVGQFKI